MTWLDDVRTRARLGEALAAVGMEAAGHARSHGVRPCPACGSVRRGGHDARGPIGLADGSGWRCHRCAAGGSVVDLLAWGLYGVTPQDLSREQWAGLRDTCACRGWCEPRADAERVPAAPRRQVIERPQPVDLGANRVHLPAAEAEAWWASCGPVDADAEACGYLRGRDLDPARLSDRDLARILPANGGALGWRCRCRERSWSEVGYRLVVPFYDALGNMSAFQGGRVRPVPEGMPKAASLAGVAIAGTVAADGLALQILRAGRAPDWWPAGHRVDVVIEEGLPDFWTAATAWGEASELAPAVFGVVSGSWKDGNGAALAARLPAGALVVIRTDQDTAGESFAQAIAQTLRARGAGLQIRRGTR
jgi:hypothetical protein